MSILFLDAHQHCVNSEAVSVYSSDEVSPWCKYYRRAKASECEDKNVKKKRNVVS